MRLPALFLLLVPVFCSAQNIKASPVEALNSLFSNGACKLEEQSWCAVEAREGRGGLTLMAKTGKPIGSLSFKYQNLDVACFIWKKFGGKEGVSVTMSIEDPTGKTFVIARACE